MRTIVVRPERVGAAIAPELIGNAASGTAFFTIELTRSPSFESATVNSGLAVNASKTKLIGHRENIYERETSAHIVSEYTALADAGVILVEVS